jgi:hypothetical protein
VNFSLQHLQTEQRYWKNAVQSLADKHGFLYDVQVDFTMGSVTLKLLHSSDKGARGTDMSQLVGKIDVDRKKRSEEKIMAEIQKMIADKSAGK